MAKTKKKMPLARQLYLARTAGEKAAATRRLNNYLQEQASKGRDPNVVYAAIKAHITMIKQREKESTTLATLHIRHSIDKGAGLRK
jgi:hypothetical protein